MSEHPVSQASLGVDLDERRLSATILRLGWPIAVEEVGYTILGVVDTVLVGQLIGADALAAVGLGTLLFFVPLSLSLALGVGTMAVVARETGRGDIEGVNRALHSTVFLATALGMLMMALLMLSAEWVMLAMGAEEDAVPLGVTFIRAASVTIILQTVLYSGSAAFRATGDTRTPMVLMLLANFLNAVLAYLLIAGPAFLPELGVLGSGLAYSIASGVAGVILIALLVRGSGILKYRLDQVLSAEWTSGRRILNVGLPAGLEQLQFHFAFMAYARIVAGLGTDTYAAHTVALRAEQIAFIPGFALGMAATTVVGQSLGASRPEAGEKAARLAWLYAMSSMCGMGVVVLAIAPQVTSMFTGEREVVDTGADLMRIFAFALPGMATGTALSGALRGAGDTRFVLLARTVSAWLVRLPLAAAFVYGAGLGAQGAWLGAVADHTVRAVVVWLRFRGGRWRGIEV